MISRKSKREIDLMKKAGGELVKHYRDTAFMGIVNVVLNIRTIKQNMERCKKDLLEFKPDVLILIDEKKVTNEIEDTFRDKLYNIELETGQIISTFIYPKDYWSNTLVYSPLYNRVKKEGIRL
jgi:hypothetical protein